MRVGGRADREKGAVARDSRMAEFNDVYRRAKYYDIAFWRDVTDEVTFIQDIYRRRLGRPLRTFLDICCGPGYHARIAAARGIRAHGLDIRPEMCAYAEELARLDGVEVIWHAADMRTVRLAEPVDMAFTSFDGLDCMHTTDEIVAHLRTVAANLTPRGLYLVEATHPRRSSLSYYGDFQYKGERNGTKVCVDWATNRPVVDPLTQVADVEVIMHVAENGHEFTIVDHARERFYTSQEYIALAKLSGVLDVIDFFGDFAVDCPLDMSPISQRTLVLMQKKD